jgi:hypothetical protein
MTWTEHNTEAFAGLHNKGKRIVVIYDEASKIADKVWEVTEGALTDDQTEIIWLAYGNPTQNTGRFRECFGKHRTPVEDAADRQPHGRGHEQGISPVHRRYLWRGQRHRQGACIGPVPIGLIDAVHLVGCGNEREIA